MQKLMKPLVVRTLVRSFQASSMSQEKIASPDEIVQKFISDNKVAVFSKTHCPFCSRAKDILRSYNIQGMKILEIENHSRMTEIQKVLSQMTGYSSVPRVFIGQKCIGGNDETVQADSCGELKRLLQAAGAL